MAFFYNLQADIYSCKCRNKPSVKTFEYSKYNGCTDEVFISSAKYKHIFVVNCFAAQIIVRYMSSI